MKTLRNYSKMYIGTTEDNEKIYLSPPSWDCGWYWGFGYLGNNNCHYHVDGLKKQETYKNGRRETEFFNLYDGFKAHFKNDFIIRESHIWALSELFETFYTLKKTAEVIGRGGAHYTSNPCKDVIKNPEEVERLNKIVLPAIFDEIYKLLEANQDNKKIFNKIVKLSIEGDTDKIIKYMLSNNIKTDDLKSIKDLKSHDYNVIHSAYWKQYHENKTK
jgi:hypothetical protein